MKQDERTYRMGRTVKQDIIRAKRISCGLAVAIAFCLIASFFHGVTEGLRKQRAARKLLDEVDRDMTPIAHEKSKLRIIRPGSQSPVQAKRRAVGIFLHMHQDPGWRSLRSLTLGFGMQRFQRKEGFHLISSSRSSQPSTRPASAVCLRS